MTAAPTPAADQRLEGRLDLLQFPLQLVTTGLELLDLALDGEKTLQFLETQLREGEVQVRLHDEGSCR